MHQCRKVVCLRISEISSCLESFPLHYSCTKQKYSLTLSKLVSVATDGTPSITGKANDFVVLLLKEKGKFLKDPRFIIHIWKLYTRKAVHMENVLRFINMLNNL